MNPLLVLLAALASCGESSRCIKEAAAVVPRGQQLARATSSATGSPRSAEHRRAEKGEMLGPLLGTKVEVMVLAPQQQQQQQQRPPPALLLP